MMSEDQKLTLDARSAISGQVSKLLSIGVAVAAIGFAVTYFSATKQSNIAKEANMIAEMAIVESRVIREQVEVLSARLSQLSSIDVDDISALIKTIETLKAEPASDTTIKISASMSEMQGRLNKLEKQNSNSEALISALGDQSINTLAVPMFRKDLDSLSNEIESLSLSVAEDLSNLRLTVSSEIGRIYDLGKWFVGLILAVTVVPLIESYFSRKKIEIKQDEDTDEKNGN